MKLRIPTRRERGATLIEFTFVGIGLIFVLISIFEASRGMWVYNLLAHAAKEGTRYAVVRGADFTAACTKAEGTDCAPTVADVAGAMLNIAPGLIPADVAFQLNRITPAGAVTSLAGSSTTGCNAPPAGYTCLAAATANPLSVLQSGDRVQIRLRYRFASAISMFWTGAGPGMVYPAFSLPASSTDTVVF